MVKRSVHTIAEPKEEERVTEAAAPHVVAARKASYIDWSGTWEEVLEGDLAMRVSELFASPDGRAATGYWQCDPCKVRLVHPFNETFVVSRRHLGERLRLR